MHGPWGCVRIMMLGCYTDRCGRVVTTISCPSLNDKDDKNDKESEKLPMRVIGRGLWKPCHCCHSCHGEVDMAFRTRPQVVYPKGWGVVTTSKKLFNYSQQSRKTNNSNLQKRTFFVDSVCYTSRGWVRQDHVLDIIFFRENSLFFYPPLSGLIHKIRPKTLVSFTIENNSLRLLGVDEFANSSYSNWSYSVPIFCSTFDFGQIRKIFINPRVDAW